MDLFRLFATPIYTNTVASDKFNKIQDDFQKTYEQLIATDGFRHNPAWDSHTHLLSGGGDFNESLLEKYDNSVFLNHIYEHARFYLKNVNYSEGDVEFELHGSWMTLTKTGMYSHIHDHGWSDISGVYYFKTNGQDGDLFFNNPNKSIKCSRSFFNYEPYQEFSPQVGRLFLFPGFIDHGVTENKTDNDRISVSFNLKIK